MTIACDTVYITITTLFLALKSSPRYNISPRTTKEKPFSLASPSLSYRIRSSSLRELQVQSLFLS